MPQAQHAQRLAAMAASRHSGSGRACDGHVGRDPLAVDIGAAPRAVLCNSAHPLRPAHPLHPQSRVHTAAAPYPKLGC